MTPFWLLSPDEFDDEEDGYFDEGPNGLPFDEFDDYDVETTNCPDCRGTGWAASGDVCPNCGGGGLLFS